MRRIEDNRIMLTTKARATAARWFGFAVCLCSAICAEGTPATNASPSLRWFDARELCLEGKGWSDTKHFYDRLPARAEGVVRAPVWSLSHDSAGMCVRFATDATAISVRWTVRKSALAMSHMPASGVSGVDLYARHQGGWRWLGAARPEKSVTTEKVFVNGLKPERHECRLYLPLYNGIEKLEIGVPVEAKFEPAAARPAGRKPIVFYGTSIVQGGCASRPGMAHPAILGRRLNWPVINLGFSGSAHCEPEVAGLLAELDPAVYVLDPLANMRSEWVAERLRPLIARLRAAHPHTPIMLVEQAGHANAPFLENRRPGYEDSNAMLRQVCNDLRKAGDHNLLYVRRDKLVGADGEATVDGVHPTDLGFRRMADAMEPVLRRALRAAR
jgi:hypothetical protein